MVVPKGWTKYKIGDCVKIETGSRNTEDKIDNGEYPFFVRSKKIEHINTWHYDCEAVLTAGDGVGTGKVFHYIKHEKFDAHQRVYVLSEFNKVDGKYFYYYFSDKFYAEVLKYTAKSSVDSVRRNMIADMELILPQDLDEQTAIAAALSDTDALIESLEKLIAKKQAVKQGAMQELLTGKRRLKGFSGEWNYRKIKEIAPLQRGFDLPQSNLRQGTIPVVFSNGINAYHNKAMAKGPGVITGRSGTIGKIHYIMEDYWPHNTALWVTDFCGNNPLFIYYLFHLVDWEKYMSGSGVPTLNRNDVHEKIMFIPSDIHEQQAIAQILTDMDNEISALQKKLDKVRRIKQGMMAELLTGRIRLKEV